jgi:hypothetical protein
MQVQLRSNLVQPTRSTLIDDVYKPWTVYSHRTAATGDASATGASPCTRSVKLIRPIACASCIGACGGTPRCTRYSAGWSLLRRDISSIFRDKNRRDIGRSQSKLTASKDGNVPSSPLAAGGVCDAELSGRRGRYLHHRRRARRECRHGSEAEEPLARER